ncbi:MAG: phosphatidylserine decarboxylase family protein [Deltaproteobacteria bacterium]|nr:phosphatidylserine decarboxylase family protein [Deltaproteobacteria bacterium]
MHKKILFFCSDGLPQITALLLLCIIVSISFRLWPHLFLIAIAILLWLLFLEFCYFFRDPERNAPPDSGVIVAAADGKIIDIRSLKEESFLKEECWRVSIFMDIFNVHVNRAPITGKIQYYRYNPGKFISAFKEKASLDNEQASIGIDGEGEGKRRIKVLVKLIAGLIARRIVVWKGLGDELLKGERISIIKFGSRVDVYFPLQVELKVHEGDRVKAGETVIGVIV